MNTKFKIALFVENRHTSKQTILSPCLRGTSNEVAEGDWIVGQPLQPRSGVIPTLLEGSRFALYCYAAFNLTSFIVYLFCSLSSSFFHRVNHRSPPVGAKGKEPKRPAHGLSKSLPFFARATLCEHSVERRLPPVSYVPISGTKELASRTPGIVWHTRSDTFVLVPQLELTRAVAQTVPDFFLILPFVRGFP